MHSYHRPRWIGYTIGLCFVSFGGLVRAQSGPPPQIPLCSFPSIASTALSESCTTLGTVMAACAADDGLLSFVLPQVTTQPSGHYPAPTANASTLEQCQCTEVGYNLYSACAACQVGDNERNWPEHDTWFTRCNADSPQSPIPVLSPKMPIQNFSSWLMQTYIPTFSVTQALAVAAGGPLPSDSATETASAAPQASVSGSPASSNANPFSSSSTNTTPIIIGSVIGAFALLAIIALGVFLCLRRKRQRTAPSAEFMKYSQVNTTGAREPLRSHSRANTADEGHGLYKRHSAIRLDSPGNSGDDAGDIEMTESGPNPPPFTPGLFKDPIFEKGVALNLAAAAAATNGSGDGPVVSGTYGASPITYSPAYSPATPSTQAHIATQYSENHGLIHGRQDTL